MDLEFSGKIRMRIGCHQLTVRIVGTKHSSFVVNRDRSQKRIGGGTSLPSIHAGIEFAKMVRDAKVDT